MTAVHRAIADLDTALGAAALALSPPQLEALGARVAQGRGIGAPGGVGPGGQAVVAALAAAYESAAGSAERLAPNDAGLALALRNAAELRREAARHPVSAVWTGPGAAGRQRLTAGAVQQLLSAANERILLMSFAVSVVPGIKEALAAASSRGVQVDCVFETEEDSRGRLSFSAASNLADLPSLRFWRWPATQRGHESASLHAKVLVVDRMDALITSANLTERAFNDNLEVGVLVRNHELAAAVDDHVRGLMTSGVLQRDGQTSQAASVAPTPVASTTPSVDAAWQSVLEQALDDELALVVELARLGLPVPDSDPPEVDGIPLGLAWSSRRITVEAGPLDGSERDQLTAAGWTILSPQAELIARALKESGK